MAGDRQLLADARGVLIGLAAGAVLFVSGLIVGQSQRPEVQVSPTQPPALSFPPIVALGDGKAVTIGHGGYDETTPRFVIIEEIPVGGGATSTKWSTVKGDGNNMLYAPR